jgi:hypothetical protein
VKSSRTLHSLACLLLTVTALSACRPAVGLTVTNRSGTVTDDYVEEPLSERSKALAPALETSNAIVDALREGDRHAMYTDMFSPEFQAVVPEAKWNDMCWVIDHGYGKIVRYKPMQWGFVSRRFEGRPFVDSIKIVECEKATIEVIATFIDDGVYAKPCAFTFRPRATHAAPKK